ncbi:lysophospholipid acyltransferase family protein [Shewanella gelidii]|uniref:Acyltransferase n=1 Tax=Shewanella gelidii TaxID=1642821 RepID=A0A917JW79_9GAMM|nr:lysophospholipid acyltransferase family protein [Shewanella gelidii]MCL1098933.1 lysophospholipid acyltransferase family protein [Shewanella gelidii]GGI90065.1 acyltransferase [Shewanella gelidii]
MFQVICRWLLKICGWKIEGTLPSQSKYIMIVAPHTSNWDFVLGVIARGALGTPINFLGKHQLFQPPWGWFFKALGGHPVDRRKNNNLVDAVVELFQSNHTFKLALAPEGTRSTVERWKTGFYHIAAKAEVPIIKVGFDFANRQVILCQPMYVTGDIENDMRAILSFYQGISGRKPKTIPDFKS